MSEFDLIGRIRRRVGEDESVPVGIGDDAAVIQPSPGKLLVATTDSLVLDRHFTTQWSAGDVGHVAMHANLSDLAAMGAMPRWALLALTLPEDNPEWLDGFLDGFLAAAKVCDVVLVGGNIARGPLNVGVQLLGEVDPERVTCRHGASAGDVLVVTGTLGGAAAALAMGEAAHADLLTRLRRPQARIRAGWVLARSAKAMIDLSDGLSADVRHLLADGLGADIRIDWLPASSALVETVSDRHQRWRFQTGGGSDYELLAAVAPEATGSLGALSREAGVALTVIGQINAGGRVRYLDGDERVVTSLSRGWDHFGHE